MLFVKNLSVAVDDKPILTNFSLSIDSGSVHAIMGPNGSGKSTLANTLMGHPSYVVTNGDIILDSEAITALSPGKRAQRGLFLAFQHPQEIPGLTVLTFIKEAYNALHKTKLTVIECKKLLEPYLDQLHIDESFLYRSLNDGFSGGEKKRFEMLQLLVLKPRIAILDEIDSGLDIDALQLVAHGIASARQEIPHLSVILITHYQRILQYIIPDHVHVLCDGAIVSSGDATLAYELEAKGYDEFRKAQL